MPACVPSCAAPTAARNGCSRRCPLVQCYIKYARAIKPRISQQVRPACPAAAHLPPPLSKQIAPQRLGAQQHACSMAERSVR